MKARNWIGICCLLGATVAYGCADDATSGGMFTGVCGNGIIEGNETCDDSNMESGDGCSSACQLEPGWTCVEGGPCTPSTEPVCGNGKVDAGERCDDGNTASGDGCSSDCKTVEPGYECPPEGGTCTLKPAVCGNGTVERGELCDDGNTTSGDGCSSDCTEIEPGFDCPKEGGPCTTTGASCGNGILEVGEECDVGDDISFGCNDCKKQPGWMCSVNTDRLSICWKMECGNGKIEAENGEVCDPPGSIDEQGRVCGDDCNWEPYCGDGIVQDGEDCDLGDKNGALEYGEGACTSSCKNAGFCGDGMVQTPQEQCDPNHPLANGGCSDTCKVKPGYMCNAVSGECVEDSGNYEQGCGSIHPNTGKPWIDEALGEECDQPGQGCSDACKAESGYKCIKSPKPCSECSAEIGSQCKKLNCGDGILDPDGYEECDLGANNGKGLGCTASCEVESGYACKTDTTGKTTCDTVCGDGIRTADEECDAGAKNGQADSGCSSVCTIKDGAYCKSNALGQTSNCTVGKCGDGKIGKGEVCDDGNTVSGDGCSADCKAVESFFRCKNSGMGGNGGSCDLTPCGDGKINGGATGFIGEECDLGAGKNVEGSGCTPFCRLEPGYECKTASCTSVTPIPETGNSSLCGNGVLDKNEECDDGNKIGGDGCSPDCRRETAFECDNSVSPSVCRPKCGDGIWNITLTKVPGKTPTSVHDLIEECDDGNNINGDGCSADCKLETGWYLNLPKVTYPQTIDLPVTFRDFKGSDITAANDKSTGSNKNIGRADQAWINAINNKYKSFTSWKNYCERTAEGGGTSRPKVPERPMTVGNGHPDFDNMSGNLCTGIMGSVGKGVLGDDGKPVLTNEAMGKACSKVDGVVGADYPDVRNHIFCPASFDTWYRDDSKMNLRIDGTLRLDCVDYKNGTCTDGTYVFDSANPPATAKTLGGNTYASINTSLTGLTKTYFAPLYNFGLNEGIGPDSGSYIKDEKLNGSFTTEIATTIQYNGKAATLEFIGDDDLWVYLNNRLFVDVGGMHSKQTGTNAIKVESCGNGQKCDKTYGLYNGGIYDLRVFHAERGRTASNFKLTLTGFVLTSKSNPSDFSTRCGDGFIAIGKEECDYGDDQAKYELMSCDPKTCKFIRNDTSATCGNGVVEAGEMCDTGYKCNDPKYKKTCEELGLSYKPNDKCDEKTCQIIGSQCGNGNLDAGEECDGGSNCTPTCTLHRCGDGYLGPNEECDLGINNNDDGRSNCTTECKVPRCGDGIVSGFAGEECDDGINDGSYGHCGVGCTKKKAYCGDGKIQAGEECDNGSANDDNKYGGCTTQCKLGAYCGDGIVQAEFGEACDEGDNNGAAGSSCTVYCRKVVN